MLRAEDCLWPVQMVLMGQGGYEPQCEVCLATAWGGSLEHARGCAAVAELVRMVRAGTFDAEKEVRRLIEFMEDDGA